MELTELMAYVGFTDNDERCLKQLWPSVEPDVDALCTDFYARAMAHPTTAAVLHDPAQVQRLMATLRVWLFEMINGPWDQDYAQRRRRIGEVHVRVGLSHDAMFAAMAAMRDGLLRLALDCDDVDVRCSVRAISRITEIDLALMTRTYNEVRNQQAVRDVQSLLVEHMPAMVILVDEAGRVFASTPAAEHRFGFSGQSSPLLNEVLPTAVWDAIGLTERLRRCFESGRAITLPRVDVHSNETTLHFAVTIVPINHGRPMALLHMDDHTAAVTNESLLRRQESLAQLGALSATIAHELRNPLAGISGALQVIASSLESDHRYHAIIGKVIQQIKSLNRLVSDLLAFARPREAQLLPAVDLREIVDGVVALAQSDHPAVVFTVDGSRAAQADPDMFRQILQNLVLNACEAAGSNGGVSIELSHETVTVRDNGPGIPHEMRDRMFQPFFTTKLKGTGLGLATSHRMAALMGMRLTLDPDRGEGATFRIHLRPDDFAGAGRS
jgi:signal transduction histidine kinase/truncated hemoglobin YjbI